MQLIHKMKPFVLILLLSASSPFLFAQELSQRQIEDITDRIPELILKNYVFQDKGANLSKEFQQLAGSKKYHQYTDPESLALVLSEDLKKISSDGHMYVLAKKTTTNQVETKSWEELERESEVKQNFGFLSAQILEQNIGYIKIIEFMNPKRAMKTAVAAMKFVENTDKLIIDLRGNGGGYPGIMLYILNHYFEGAPTLLSTTYSSNTTETATTYSSDLVYGELRVGTPLYLLIDGKTGSAAEYFAYTAQAFDKAKIIGEKSAGAAHMNELFELPHNFRISISVSAPIVSKVNSNWEMKGVEPDHKTAATISINEVVELIRSN